MTSMNTARPRSTLTLVATLTLLCAGCATLDGTSNTRSAAVSPPAGYVVCTGGAASRLPDGRANECRRAPSLPPSLALIGGSSTQRMH